MEDIEIARNTKLDNIVEIATKAGMSNMGNIRLKLIVKSYLKD